VEDVYLESVWVAGAGGLGGLANLVGDRRLAGDADGRAERARASLAAKFWNPRRDFFLYGFDGKGEWLTQELSQPNWGIGDGGFSTRRNPTAPLTTRRMRAGWRIGDCGVSPPTIGCTSSSRRYF
jgi:hypothetical protein